MVAPARIPELRRVFDEALVDGELATCDMVRLELLHSARSAIEFAEIRQELAALPDCPIETEQWKRVVGLGAAQHPGRRVSSVGEAPRSPDRCGRGSG